MKFTAITLGLILSLNGLILAQSNPIPHTLSNGNFEFTGFTDGSSNQYPSGMTGWAGAVPIQEPGNPGPTDYQAKGDAELRPGADDYLLATIKNEADSGISIRGEALDETALAIVIAISTTNTQGVSLEWVARTIHSFVYSISEVHLQYRIGTEGDWTNVDGNVYDIGVYGAENLPETTFNWDLPAELENQEVVQLRWLVVGAGQTSATTGRGATGRAHIKSIKIAPTEAIPQKPTTDFTASKTNPEVDEPFTFTNLSTGAPDSYFWDFGDGNTSAEANPFHSYAADGFYSVTLITSNAAGSDTLVKPKFMAVGDTSNIDTTTSINVLTNSVKPVKVFPNPSSGKITLNIDLNDLESISVFNGIGSLIKVIPNVGINNSLDLSFLPNGLYHLKLIGSEGISSSSVIIQK
ncbi:MAG: hypothetical protein ACI81S_001207 [Sphingobacteriales bacterium]|jgi:hypothetical protein